MDSVFSRALEGDVDALSTALRNVNATNKRKWTLLHYAARYGKADLVTKLTANGADKALRNDDGKTAYDLAVQWGFSDVAQLLGESSSSPSSSSSTSSATASTAAPAATSTAAFTETHFFAGSLVNRLSNERKKDKWALEALERPSSRGVVLSGSNVLLCKAARPGEIAVVWIDQPLLARLINQQLAAAWVLIGQDEGHQQKSIIFAVDLAGNETVQNDVIASSKADGAAFQALRPAAFQIAHNPDAAVVAQARAILDWNARNQFCAMCGTKTTSAESGYKRVCGDTDCKTHASVQNVSYPRLDAVVIGLVLSPDRTKILLGRGVQFPDGFFSCLAGFMEPGETIEEALRREVFEESGIRVGAVRYHSSQPWPFPSQLMIGCVGQAINEEITVDPEELAECKWVAKADVADALKRTMDPRLPGMKVPPKYAIANVLMRAWVDEESLTPLARI